MENKIVKDSLISNELNQINVIQDYFVNNYQTIPQNKVTLFHYTKVYKQAQNILLWYKQFIKDNEKDIPVLIFDELVNRVDIAMDSINHILKELDILEQFISKGQEINIDNLLNLVGKHMQCMYSLELKTEEMINEDLNKNQISIQTLSQSDDNITTISDSSDDNNDKKEEQSTENITTTINDSSDEYEPSDTLESSVKAEEVNTETEYQAKVEQINKFNYNKIEYDRDINYSVEIFTARTLNEIELLSAKRKMLENKTQRTILNKMEISRIKEQIQMLQSSLSKVQEKNLATSKDKKMDKLYDREQELKQKLDSVQNEEYDSNIFEGIKKIRIKRLNNQISKSVAKFNVIKQSQTEKTLSQFKGKQSIEKFKAFFKGNFKATMEIYHETASDFKRFISKLKNNELQEEINAMNSMGVLVEGAEEIGKDGEIVSKEEGIKLAA